MLLNKEHNPQVEPQEAVAFGELSKELIDEVEYITVAVTLTNKDWGAQETELLKERFSHHNGLPIEWQLIDTPTRDKSGNKVYKILGRTRPQTTGSQT